MLSFCLFKMQPTMRYVQYGCGLSAPKEWVNYDISPTLQIRKIPLAGKLITKTFNQSIPFPDNVKYGDIVKGLPETHEGADAVFCSHVLEHLSLEDLRTALKNTYAILKPGGIFRFVLPDLEFMAKEYVNDLPRTSAQPSIQFVSNMLMGVQKRERGLKAFIVSYFGNSRHLWMWDYVSLSGELSKVGFKNIRRSEYHGNPDTMFNLVEDKERFDIDTLCIEAYK